MNFMIGSTMNAMIDTHALVKMMQDAGIAQVQAEAITNAIKTSNDSIRNQLITAKDLDNSISRLQFELQKSMSEDKLDLHKSINESKFELQKSIHEGKIQNIRWALGSQILLLAAIVALTNFTKLL
jgi:hypothetical protein